MPSLCLYVLSMNFRIVHFLLLLAVFPFFVSCSEDEASDVVVYIENELPDTVAVGKFIPLEIFAITPNEYVKEIRISTFDADNGEVLRDCIFPNVVEYRGEYVFQVPQVASENTEMKLYLDAYDNIGNKQRFTLKFFVIGADLKPLDGLVFYNPLSGNNDGFDVLSKATIRRATYANNDSTSFWLRQFTEEEMLESPENLPLELNTSATGSRVTFAVSNSYDYGKATTISLEAAYSSMSVNNYVSQIKQGDIILIGVDNVGWGVMQVLDIVDNPGVNDDKMIINIKIRN